MILRIIVITVAFLSFQMSFAQQKTRADRFFEKGDYINAAKLYELEIDQNGYSKHLLMQISTAYYNTFEFRKAYRYLRTLTSGKFYDKNDDKSYDNRYNFMMHQVLSALGEYDKAIVYLAQFKKNNQTEVFNKTSAIKTIEAFKLKDDDYKIEEVDFNSDASEFGAVKKDGLVYFTSDRKPNSPLDRKYKWTHRPFLDIYKVKVDDKGVSSEEAEGVSKNINSKLHEGNFCFTKDRSTLYISKSNSEKGNKKYDSIKNNAIHLYRSDLKDGSWSAPIKLDFNNVNYSIEHPWVSPDGTKLYFASNMPGGFGDFDLYFVEILSNGTYGLPQNLGAVVNTDQREQFPFIAADGHLFFSSNGHLGLGMMDVFVSEFKEGVFVKPVNLGAPVNSNYDDFSLTYFNEKEGFFASNRKKANDDIYRFAQTGEIFLREYIAKFEVKDFKTDNYITNAKVSLYDENKQQLYDNQLDSIASFSMNVLPGQYQFTASSEKYEEKTKPVLVKEKDDQTYIIYLERKSEEIVESKVEAVNPPRENFEQKKKEPTAEELREQLLQDKVGPPVIERNGKLYFDLPPIYFDYDKWNIRADSKKVLDDFALKLEKYKTVYIKISSHTDSRGTDSYNQVLSEKRAESTRNYLALIGYVNARRMKFEGFGESQPLIDCGSKTCSEQEHQINRRSEFEIVKY